MLDLTVEQEQIACVNMEPEWRRRRAALVRPRAHTHSEVEVLAMRTCDRMKLKVTALAKGKVESNRR